MALCNEGEVELHGKPLGSSNASFEHTVSGLGGDPNDPFVIFDDVKDSYANRSEELKKSAAKRKEQFGEWASKNENQAEQLSTFLNGELPYLDWESIEQKDNVATRNASSAVLSYLADHVDNMIVSSADLSNSDKTDGFLKKKKAFVRGDFSGGLSSGGCRRINHGRTLYWYWLYTVVLFRFVQRFLHSVTI